MSKASVRSIHGNKTKKNFVKENAKVKIGKCSSQKDITSGLYTQHHPSQCNHMLNAQPIHLKKESQKQVVRIQYQENIRDLLIPTTVNVYPTILPVQEIKRIAATSQLVTIDEKKVELQRKCNEMKYLEEECEKRKAHLKEIDKLKIDENLYDSSDEAAEKQKILDRALVKQLEESEEFKRVNHLIVSKKCQLTLAAQVAEKNEIQREIRDYNFFVEKTILNDCDRALQLESENALKRRELKAKLAENLKAYVDQKELAEKLAAENALKMDKAESLARAAENDKLKEKERMERLQQMQKKRQDIENFKALRETLKSKALEAERISEAKALEYMRKKQENIKRIAEEKRLVKEEKQRKSDELLMLQAKLLETKKQQGESNIKRLEEEKEREFRRKAKEDALKRKKLTKEIQDVRALQLREIHRKKEMEQEQEKLALSQLIEKLNSVEMEEKRKMERNRMEQEQLQNEIINQIKQKELIKQMAEEKARVEYAKKQEMEKQRIANIENVIHTKLLEMQEAKIPLEDILDIQRKIKSKFVN